MNEPARPESPVMIGRYRIVDRIGRGGMSMVYRAQDDALGRSVALKVLTPDLAAEPELRQRFFREARLAAQIQHRGVVSVLDVGEDQGRLYIIMELLEGATLDKYLRATPTITLEHKLDLMVQACEGLAVAHARGICHRDVKPANLFVQADGSVKLLDFGIARLASSTLTTVGLLGTPDFMSPEQARGEEVDQRSDVFSLGAVFYFMLTGRKPFKAADLAQTLHRVECEQPDPLFEAECPAALAAVVSRALQKVPDDRYPRVADALVDILKFRRQYEEETRRRTTALATQWSALQALAQEHEDLAAALQLPDNAATALEPVVSLRARHPEFHDQVTLRARAGPFDQAHVALIAREVEEVSASLSGKVERAREAATQLQQARALNGIDDRASLQAYDLALAIIPEMAAVERERDACRGRVAAIQHREDQVRGYVGEASAALAGRRWDAVMAACAAGLAIAGRHDELERLARQATAEQEKDQEARRLERIAVKASFATALEAEQADDAERVLARLEALGIARDELDLRRSALSDLRAALDQRQQVAAACQAAIEHARQLVAGGRHAFALDHLRSALDEFGPHAGLEAEHARVAAQLEQLIAAHQRRLDAAAARERAQGAWRHGDLAEARAAIHLALDLDRTDADALQLETEMRAELREIAARASRESHVCEHVARSRENLRRRLWAQAASEAARALALDPTCTAAAHLATDAEESLRQERLSDHRGSERAARDDAARPLFEAARGALESGQALRARALAEAALAQVPDHDDAMKLLADTARAGVAGTHGSTVDDPTLDIAIPRSLGERLALQIAALVRQLESFASSMLRRGAVGRAARDHAGPPPPAKV
jgi:hypothetical protein